MRHPWALSVLFFLTLSGCSKTPLPATDARDPLQGPKALLSEGRYEEAIQSLKEGLTHPGQPSADREAQFLEAYATLFGRGDFQATKAVCKRVAQLGPADNMGLDAQRMIADCQFWLGHHQTAYKEYKKLVSLSQGAGMQSYALFQAANCLLLEDKVAEALDAFRNITDHFQGTSMADSAQISIVNSYLRLQDFKQARIEAERLVSSSRDPGLQDQVRQGIKDMMENESFQGNKGSEP